MLFRKVLLVPVEGKNGQKIEHFCSELHLALGDQTQSRDHGAPRAPQSATSSISIPPFPSVENEGFDCLSLVFRVQYPQQSVRRATWCESSEIRYHHSKPV
jgi:hypothetical protein